MLMNVQILQGNLEKIYSYTDSRGLVDVRGQLRIMLRIMPPFYLILEITTDFNGLRKTIFCLLSNRSLLPFEID